jgi:hypothetical protein
MAPVTMAAMKEQISIQTPDLAIGEVNYSVQACRNGISQPKEQKLADTSSHFLLLFEA